MMFVHRFTVVGNGAFPLDMLRYDQCFPASEGNSGGLHQDDGDKETRKVRMCHYSLRKDWKPTQERWRSFLWAVEAGTHIVDKAK